MPKTALLGYGATNKAIRDKYKNTKSFDIFDDSFTHKRVDKYKNSFYPSRYFKTSKYNNEIITPGISPNNPLSQKAKHLISDYDYFKNRFPFSVWISGTNGKTTLTQMIHYLLGDSSEVGGNIGCPLASLSTKKPIWILETSSFTLHYTNHICPDIYLLLPISKDHLSWHKSFDNYVGAKLKPLGLMNKQQIAILPRKYKHIKTNSNAIYYDDESSLAKYFDINTSAIKINQPFLISAILALCVQKILFDKCDISKINTFKRDKHKIEIIKDSKDRIWIDDSKATNISASLAAIKSCCKNYPNKKIHLILGGDSKGISLKPLIKFISSIKISKIYIYSIGKCANEITELSQEYKLTCTHCKTLENSVQEINKKLDNNSLVLLSPACASLDQFSSYKQRGEVFQSKI